MKKGVLLFVAVLLIIALTEHCLMANENIATVLETKVIYKELGRYIGWPTITKTHSGELLVVFSGNRDAHVCPYGVTQMVRSHDNGKTWSEPVTLLVSWFTSLAFAKPKYLNKHPEWKRHAEKLGPETRQRWLGNWTRRSLDNGKTWEAPVQQNVSAPHGPIKLKDGRLLYVGTGSRDKQKIMGVEESRNDGKTWHLMATIQIAEEDSIKYYWEPHVAELPGGKLVAMFRYQPKNRSQCYLRQSESVDGGVTWTRTHKTPIWGYPPHLQVLDNGWLLVVYGVRRKPYSERACISRDGGETWEIENEITLSPAMNGDLGYPASVQLDDGSILTVYYQIDKPGEKTCLMSTHWRLNKN
ncbi:MAG: exo-alpha-sialidase [Actinobacteria bacterium]|nr:exo-alpha-sialidase [Actinomycetota bacterium]